MNPSLWLGFFIFMTKKDDLICLGYCTKPHGIKGEIELVLHNDPSESILEDDVSLWLFPSGPKSLLNPSGVQMKIESLRFGNKVILKLDEIKDRTQLEKMLPFEIFLSREFFPELDEDEFYLVDLIDLPVLNEEGDKIGKLESFSDNGQQYLFNIRLDPQGELLTLPYVKTFFPEVNTKDGYIRMILPEYTE